MITAHPEIAVIERLIGDKYIEGLAIKGSQYFRDNLYSAINNIAQGGVYLDPSLLNKLRESTKENGISNLTRKEFEIFIHPNAYQDACSYRYAIYFILTDGFLSHILIK